MSTSPPVSVVIPVYNGARTIRATIESVLRQTHSDFEIVLVNDGSTDQTLAVIYSIVDPRIRCFSKSNGGQATARNCGISKSTGEYIAFLDADDLWHPSKLKHHKEILDLNPAAGAAYCKTIGLGAEETLDSVLKRISPDLSPKLPSGRILEPLIRSNIIGSGSNFFVRRNVIEKIGGFNQNVTGVEDWDFYLRVAEKYEIHCVQNQEVFYRIYSKSFSTRNIAAMESGCLLTVDAAFNRAPPELHPLKSITLTGVYRYLLGKSRRSESRYSMSGIGRGVRYFLMWGFYLIRSKLSGNGVARDNRKRRPESK